MTDIIKSDLKFRYDKMLRLNPNKVKIIILHHICASNMSVEDIHKIHLRNGWAGIGYHYYIRKDGSVYEGRPDVYVGSHCQGNNSCSIGIAFEGDFRKDKPTDEQIKSCREVCKVVKSKYKNIYKILNHRDLCKTLCPVANLKEMVGLGCLN